MHHVFMIVLMAIGIWLGFTILVHLPAKAIGLCLVIVGTIFCLGVVGMVVGIPMILIGGMLLFA